MTEAEWQACAGPRAMLPFVGEWGSARKQWLFACASCRLVWHLLPDVCRQVVVTVERYADGLAGTRELVALLDDFFPHNVSLSSLRGGEQAAQAVGYLGWP